MDIEISPHARESMQKHFITEDEVKAAIIDGETEFEIIAKGEKRYVNVLTEKTRKLVAIWTYKNSKKRVITCYPLRRKV